MRHFDVVVIGAGPAGSASALSLRKSHPHLSVLLLEASDFHLGRPGEALSLDAVPLLQQLEVFDFFLEQNHRGIPARNDLPAKSPASCVDASGGWQLDRSRFDSMLAGYAAASGAAFMRAALTRVQLGTDGRWQLSTGNGAATHSLSASFVIDASGRSARFAAEIGIAQTAHDSLVCLTRIVEPSAEADAGHGCLIEAFEHGWWYSVPVADNRVAVSVMTDADISKRLQLSGIEDWKRHLDEATQTRARIGQAVLPHEVGIRAAHTRNLTSYGGSNWLAVGDAASSIDPLGSQGVLRALRFGLAAGKAAGEQFGKRQIAELQDYVQLVHAEFDNHLMQRLEDYRIEQRWPGAPFWVRRHVPQNPPAFVTTGGPRSKITLGGSRLSRS